MNGFEDQSVLVVGASSGIGRAVVRSPRLAGARVIMASRSTDRLLKVAEDLSDRKFEFLSFDMRDRAEVDDALAPLGAIDHVVLTAVADETSSAGAIDATTPEMVERSFDKLRGYANIMSSVAGHLRRTGSVVVTSAVSAHKPPSDFSLLAAAAGAVEGFGKALAVELAPTRVNVIMPGVVDTPIHAGHRDGMRAWAESSLPARRFGQPSDIADAILFLMANRYVTGHTLVADGGMSLS